LERLKEEPRPGTKVDLVVREKEAHAACILDAAIWLSEGDPARAVLVWMSSANFSPEIKYNTVAHY